MAKDLLAQPKDLLARESFKQRGDRIASFVGRGIADVVGAPADIIGAGLNLIPGIDIQDPVGGSEALRQTFGGAKGKPKTTGEFIAQTTGEAAGALLPVTRAAQIVSRSAGTAGRVARQIVQSAVSAPKTAVAVELAGGAGAGAGRRLGEETDSPFLPLSRIYPKEF